MRRLLVLTNLSNKLWHTYLDKLTDEQLWLGLIDIVIRIILVLIITGVLVRIIKKMITNIFSLRAKGLLRISERREATIMKLLQNIVTYFVYFISITIIISMLGGDVKGVIAGAGVVGLAVGFGAQSLVKDVITGFFIVFEDQFGVGDYVRIGSMEGTVEELGLRTTKLKSVTGELNIIPNGNILEVTNYSIYNSVAVVDISIAYEGDIERAERVIQELLDTMPAKYEELVDVPRLLGVQMLGASEVVLRVTAETLPMQHFYIARQLRKELKETLDQNGIEIPFPRMVMYNRQENEG
ncbi:MAG: mechanosensitive ion channel family protein [Bacillus sp. (in: firmicutes)]